MRWSKKKNEKAIELIKEIYIKNNEINNKYNYANISIEKMASS